MATVARRCGLLLVASLLALAAHGILAQDSSSSLRGSQVGREAEELLAVDLGEEGWDEAEKVWFGSNGGGGGGRWPFCAWEGTLTKNISNIFALENTAAYHFLAPWMKWQGTGGVPTFRITGTYPRTQFMNFATYSVARRYLRATAMINDYQIKPTHGKNPFMEPCSPEEVGTYEIYVTLHGDKGYPNEIRLLANATDNAMRSYLSPLIIRFYGYDPTMSTDPALRVWGGVPIPKVHYQESDGRWVEVPLCSEQERAFPAKVIERIYTLGQGIDTTRLPGRLSYRGDCPTRSIGNGLVPGFLLHGGSLDVVPVSFQNPASVYAYWCMSPNVMQIQREEFFIKIKARLPKLPGYLFEGAPLVWDRYNYDTRFISITTMDLNAPHRVYDSISGHEIRDWYQKRQGDGWDGRFTIVAGQTQEGIRACGMIDDSSEIVLNWNFYDDASLRQFRVPHVTYRDILSAVDTTGRRGKTATDVARTCTDKEGAYNDCNNWQYVRDVMQDYYPVVEIWNCNRTTGHATRLA